MDTVRPTNRPCESLRGKINYKSSCLFPPTEKNSLVFLYFGKTKCECHKFQTAVNAEMHIKDIELMRISHRAVGAFIVAAESAVGAFIVFLFWRQVEQAVSDLQRGGAVWDGKRVLAEETLLLGKVRGEIFLNLIGGCSRRKVHV